MEVCLNHASSCNPLVREAVKKELSYKIYEGLKYLGDGCRMGPDWDLAELSFQKLSPLFFPDIFSLKCVICEGYDLLRKQDPDLPEIDESVIACTWEESLNAWASMADMLGKLSFNNVDITGISQAILGSAEHHNNQLILNKELTEKHFRRHIDYVYHRLLSSYLLKERQYEIRAS